MIDLSNETIEELTFQAIKRWNNESKRHTTE